MAAVLGSCQSHLAVRVLILLLVGAMGCSELVPDGAQHCGPAAWECWAKTSWSGAISSFTLPSEPSGVILVLGQGPICHGPVTEGHKHTHCRILKYFLRA